MTAPQPMESASGIVPRQGQEVRTRDGQQLGWVKEVAAYSFKIDAPMARDYWLSSASVLRSDDGVIQMDFDAEVAEDYHLSAPGVGAESPMLDAQIDSFGSNEEQAERREQMEHGGPRRP
ncbi:MAG: hypothetical protein IT304_00370 [Dehalococcoidia bacterium]|nr:hypothetical protein [Dehalococcoidia bacterium]